LGGGKGGHQNVTKNHVGKSKDGHCGCSLCASQLEGARKSGHLTGTREEGLGNPFYPYQPDRGAKSLLVRKRKERQTHRKEKRKKGKNGKGVNTKEHLSTRRDKTSLSPFKFLD